VLYVDDAALLDLAETFLGRHGLDVEAAEAAAGLRRLEGETFGCVVSDYQMPGTDGIGFLRRFRERYPELPFVLFTGEGSEAVASDALAAGVTDYLRKERGTSQFEVLANRVERAVEERRTRNRLDANERMLRAFVEEPPGAVYRTRVEDGVTERLGGEVYALTGYHHQQFTSSFASGSHASPCGFRWPTVNTRRPPSPLQSGFSGTGSPFGSTRSTFPTDELGDGAFPGWPPSPHVTQR
jgi:CheY-like chemotaxis protein